MLRKIVGAFILLALIFVIPILRGESDAKSPGGVLGILAMFAICAWDIVGNQVELEGDWPAVVGQIHPKTNWSEE